MDTGPKHMLAQPKGTRHAAMATPGQHPLRGPARTPPNWLESNLSSGSFCSQEIAFPSVSMGRNEGNSQRNITSQNKSYSAESKMPPTAQISEVPADHPVSIWSWEDKRKIQLQLWNSK